MLIKKRYWILLTLLLMGFLVLRAFPATWVIYGLQQGLPGLQVSGVSGSLWRGQADYSQWVNRGHTLPLGRLNWELKGLSLFTLNPCVTFSAVAQGQSIKGEGCYGVLNGTAKLTETDISLPIERVSPFFNVNLRGTVDGFIEQLLWQPQGLGDSELNLLWQQASFYNGNLWVDLGDIQTTATDDNNGGLASQIRSVNDGRQPPPLNVNLQALLTQLTAPKPRMRVTGTVVPSGQQGLSWGPLLQLVGEPIAGGGYRIDINE